jgi:multiple sugar transport system ATP-binding protein
MNLMRGSVVDGELRVPLTSIPLDDRLRTRLAGVEAGRRLLVGIRPEDFEDAALVRDGRTGHVLDAVVDVLEPTGADLYAHLAGDAHQQDRGARVDATGDGAGAAAEPRPVGDVVARFGTASRVREGARAKVWLDTSHIHLFDADTGERLPSG